MRAVTVFSIRACWSCDTRISSNQNVFSLSFWWQLTRCQRRFGRDAVKPMIVFLICFIWPSIYRSNTNTSTLTSNQVRVSTINGDELFRSKKRAENTSRVINGLIYIRQFQSVEHTKATISFLPNIFEIKSVGLMWGEVPKLSISIIDLHALFARVCTNEQHNSSTSVTVLRRCKR